MLFKKYKISRKFNIIFTRIYITDDDLCSKCDDFFTETCNYSLCKLANNSGKSFSCNYHYAYLKEKID